jgi:putative inorganic carbon (HCO3(-)) transporter
LRQYALLEKDFNNLQREIDIIAENLRENEFKLAEAENAMQGNISSFDILERASVPTDPLPTRRKLLLLASLIAQLVCLYFTYSRGAWIALAAGGLVSFGLCLTIFWHIFMNNKALKALLFGGTALGVVGGGAMVLRSPAIMSRIQSLISGGEHSSNQFRINVWNSSFAMIQDFWLTGIGVGNKVFQKIYVYYMATGFHALSTYNIFLEVWVEMGIIGIGLFLLMLLVHLARCLWGVVQDIDYTARLFLAAAFTGLTGLLVHGMVDTIFFRPPLQILFWFLLALIAIVSRDELAYQHQLTR